MNALVCLKSISRTVGGSICMMQPNARMPSCDKHRNRLQGQFDWKVPYHNHFHTHILFLSKTTEGQLYTVIIAETQQILRKQYA